MQKNLRTRAVADVGDQLLNFGAVDVAALAAVAYHQPITRDGLEDIKRKGDIRQSWAARLSAPRRARACRGSVRDGARG